MTRLPAQLPAATASVSVIESTPLQPAVAVALPVLAGRIEAVQSMTLLAGQVIDGLVVSTIVMVWLHALEHRFEVTLRNSEKLSPQTLPETMLTVRWFVGPEMEDRKSVV